MITIICKSCGKEIEKTGRCHRYCKQCAHERRLERSRVQPRLWAKKHRERINENNRNRYRNNPKVKKYIMAYTLKRHKEHPEIRIREGRTYRKKIRHAAIIYYGGDPPRCLCCGEHHEEFLCIDHIRGGGRKHLQSIKMPIYQWLKNNNYPIGFRVLCYNCNQSISACGYCPHQKENINGVAGT